MTVLAVTAVFRLREGRVGAFQALLRDDARASVARQPSCLRLDLCTPERKDGHGVVLFERCRDRANLDAHLPSDHVRAFGEATQAMAASKRVTLLGAEPTP